MRRVPRAPPSVLEDIRALELGDPDANQRIMNRMKADGVTRYVIPDQSPIAQERTKKRNT